MFQKAVVVVLGLFLVASAGEAQPGRGGSARVFSMAVRGDGVGVAQYLICTAVRGKGKATLNNTVPNTIEGNALVQSFRASLESLRADPRPPAGVKADFTKFDLNLEFEDRNKAYVQSSAALAAGVAAYSAMTGRPLRPRVALTGDVSLDGEAKPIGGLGAKIPAAAAAGASMVLVPVANFPDVMRLPYEQRISVPIFGVSSLSEAIQAALPPNDPSGRGFAAYLDQRDGMIIRFQILYEKYVKPGPEELELTRYRPELERAYEDSFKGRDEGKEIQEVLGSMASLLKQYPYDAGLRSTLAVGQRVCLNLAAAAEAADGDRAVEAGDYAAAARSYKTAAGFNPAEPSYAMKAVQAAREQFLVALKPLAEAAEKSYREGQYGAAAETYKQLAESAKDYDTPFPVMERVATARARAAADPKNPGLRRAAGGAAERAGLWADAIAEYELLVEADPSGANAAVLYESYFSALKGGDRAELEATAKRAVARAEGIAARSMEPAQVFLALTEMTRQKGLYGETVALLERAAQHDKSTRLQVRLAQAHLEHAERLSGEEEREQYARAAKLAEGLQSLLFRDEQVYEIRESSTGISRPTAPRRTCG